MSEVPADPTPDQAEEYFRQMLADGEIEQPDEVEYDPAANELVFFWHEPHLAVVLELDSDAPWTSFRRASSRQSRYAGIS